MQSTKRGPGLGKGLEEAKKNSMNIQVCKRGGKVLAHINKYFKKTQTKHKRHFAGYKKHNNIESAFARQKK